MANSSARRIIHAALLLMAGGLATPAFASTGCASLNGSRLADGSTTGSDLGTGFDKGDLITITLTDTGAGSSIFLLNSSTVTQLTATLSSNGATAFYLVPAATTDVLVIGSAFAGAATATWSCVSGEAWLNNFDEIIPKFMQTNTQAAQQAISSILGLALANFLENKKRNYLKVDSPDYIASTGGLPPGAYGLGMGPDGPALSSAAQSSWQGWADGRISGNGGEDIKGRPGQFTWDHFMVATGAHYSVSPGLVVGGFGSIEDFDSKRTDSPSKLEGQGISLGAYGAWIITRQVMLAANVSHAWLDYKGSVGAAEADFDAGRWMMMASISGTEKIGRFLVTPQAEVSWLREAQNSYQTSLGTQVAANHTLSGGANTGVVVSLPVPLTDGMVLMPFVGSFADYRFGVEDKSSGTILGFGDGWSMRLRGGATVSAADDWSVTLDGDVGNVGGKGGEYFTGHLNGSLRF